MIFALMMSGIFLSNTDPQIGGWVGLIFLVVPSVAVFKPLPQLYLGNKAFSASVAIFVGLITSAVSLAERENAKKETTQAELNVLNEQQQSLMEANSAKHQVALEALLAEVSGLQANITQLEAEIGVLQSNITHLEADISKRTEENDILRVEKRQLQNFADESAYKSREKNAELQDIISSLENQLALYRTPIAPLIEEIVALIRDETFISALQKLEELKSLPLFDHQTLNIFINEAEQLVRPIPSNDYSRNLDAYRFLARLAPENPNYVNKINFYEQKLTEKERRAELNAIYSIISLSDDLNVHKEKMAEAALNLIKSRKCSRQQIDDDNGGWIKSNQRAGQYFMDCGNQRVWFNPIGTGNVYTDNAVPESTAAQICRSGISEQTTVTPNFHFFDRGYNVHSPGKSVTYVQGFDVINGFGVKMKYRAYCLIQPSGALEITLQRK